MSNNPEFFEDALDNQLAQLKEILLRKRKAYGNRNLVIFGEFGIMVRTYDKIERLRNLTAQGRNPDEETVDDTWNDIAGYSILTRIFRDGFLELPDRPVKPTPLNPIGMVVAVGDGDRVTLVDGRVADAFQGKNG